MSPDSPTPRVVTLRMPMIYRLAAAHIVASNGAIATAVGSASSPVAILDSGASHHLWPFYKAFINYYCVFNQHVIIADNSKIRIKGR